MSLSLHNINFAIANKDGNSLSRPIILRVEREYWKTWKVENESKSVDLEKKDAINRARWRVGVRKIADKVG